jgi:glycosyltransferase involved in cell wall biosynthesis
MLSHAVAPDRTGGLERYVRELAAALVRAGADVAVLAKRLRPDLPRRELGDDGVEIVRHDAPAMNHALYAVTIPFAPVRAVLRQLRGRPEIVHAHYVLPAAVPAILGRPFVSTFHAPMWRELLSEREGRFALPAPTQRLAQGSVRALESLVARRAGATVVLSRFMLEQLRALSPRAARHAHVVPGGIDIDHFKPAGGVPAGGDGGPITLFTARRLTPRTGVQELVEAMGLLRREHRGVRLAIAGEGALREPIAQQIGSAGLGDRVTLLGRISEQELVRRYRSADLVVMPTQRLEGFGLTTAEALACGTPVLGTPVGATPELLAPLDPALVSDDASPAGIARALDGLLGDRGRLAELRRGTRARVAPAMGWDAIAARYLEIYAPLARTGRAA